MKIYIVETGAMQQNGNVFWYDKILFTSRKSAEHNILNGMSVNKGLSLVIKTGLEKKNETLYNYNCNSTDGRTMVIRKKLSVYDTQ